ncbi:OsmC family protein [Thalassotalea sp. ND16A]|uniref:OsmC family protein n=1 Tax=Thalassotalea sp. ND16A TaxID=1535422 RepID=UPI00051D707F|nr:OsmC family protein [Thalassotalea sp. ND16A]KGJ90478.1 hypothetical protein ND16A_1874 [Thalassotalea sp. ND16A]
MEQHAMKTIVCNGVNVTALNSTIDAVKQDPSLANFIFKAENQWLGGGHNRSKIQDFYGCGQTDNSRALPFILDADEPPVLLSTDKGANPVEYILHGLAGCMTTSMVYHAAARGIAISGLSSLLEGDLDLRGFLGLSTEVNKGYSEIRVKMRVKTSAAVETLRECVNFSPVYEMISRSVPVVVDIETY